MEIEDFIQRIINGTGGFKTCEEYEIMVHHIDRETSIASWVIRCLANPKCEGSKEVLDAIIKQRETV